MDEGAAAGFFRITRRGRRKRRRRLERAEAEGKATEDEGESVGGLLALDFLPDGSGGGGDVWGGYGIGLSMGQEMLGAGVGTVLGLVVGVVLRATVGGRSGGG
ncbi:MAG: hypothetical protein R3B46_00850 [Phycisphaerales bacterium]